jgi:hypothetical protein
MGCWYKTCGLSNLYIQDNEPVYTFVLLQNDSQGSCYNTSFYTPVLVSFECKYNDYGGGQDAHGIALKPLMEAIDKIRVKEPDAEELTVDAFFDLAHEGFTYKNFWGNERLVDFVMMRKDLVDYILTNWKREEYVGNKYSQNGYAYYTYADVLNDIPAFIATLTASINEVNDKWPSDVSLSMFKMSNARNFTSLFTESSVTGLYNLVIHALRHDIRNDALNPGEYLIDLIAQVELEDAIAFTTEYVKGAFINSILDSTRRQWIPGCHEGSQSCNHDGYRMLLDATAKMLDNDEERWDE